MSLLTLQLPVLIVCRFSSFSYVRDETGAGPAGHLIALVRGDPVPDAVVPNGPVTPSSPVDAPGSSTSGRAPAAVRPSTLDLPFRHGTSGATVREIRRAQKAHNRGVLSQGPPCPVRKAFALSVPYISFPVVPGRTHDQPSTLGRMGVAGKISDRWSTCLAGMMNTLHCLFDDWNSSGHLSDESLDRTLLK
jgi:hypothetical protein